MEVVIAKDENGKTVGIVCAQSKALALAYWHGQGLRYDTARTLDELDIPDAVRTNPSGVVPILKTHKLPLGGNINSSAVLVK